MRCLGLSEFCQTDINVRDLEIFPESWTKRKSFSQYEKTPRPLSALFFIFNDIKVSFYPQGEPVKYAGKGDVVWIPAGVRYRVTVEGGTENQIDTYTLNFRLLDSEGETVALSERIGVIAKEQNQIFRMRVKTLVGEVNKIDGGANGQGRNYLKIKSEFFSLFDSIVNASVSGDGWYYPIRMGAEALKNEWDQNRKMEEYAAMCGISEAYFYRCFRKCFGKSPVEYRNMLRLSNAETMLRHTDMRINEISETVGFDDPFYFCRIFTKQFGVSPRGYRSGLSLSEKKE